MGNKGSRRSVNKDQRDSVYTGADDRIPCSQKIIHNRRSSLHANSPQSSCIPWSRTSRRRWSESTLNVPYRSCKTAWPVSQLESLFLPHFPLEDRHQDSKYKKLPDISKGAFGVICPILDLEANELFALKVLSKSKIVESNLIKQVIEEVQIQRACGHHPFIASLHLNWQSRRHLYIASEYIEGGELWQLLDKLGVLPVELVRLYVAQIALAIDFLHNAGVIYRDLKPENVLLDADANTKLIDFGLSKWLRTGQTTRTICGTSHYMGMVC